MTGIFYRRFFHIAIPSPLLVSRVRLRYSYSFHQSFRNAFWRYICKRFTVSYMFSAFSHVNPSRQHVVIYGYNHTSSKYRFYTPPQTPFNTPTKSSTLLSFMNAPMPSSAMFAPGPARSLWVGMSSWERGVPQALMHPGQL